MFPRASLNATLVAALAFLHANRGLFDETTPPGNDSSLLNQDELSELLGKLQENPDPTIQGAMSGGLFRCASSDHPLACLFAVEMLDFDLDGCGPEVTAVPSPDLPHESAAGALVRAEPVEFGAFYRLEDASLEAA
jgi:hypothetical protein